MDIQQARNSNNISYQGIRISTSDFKTVRNMVTSLRFVGAQCAGHKTYKIGNSINEKKSISNYIREHYFFMDNEYGVVFFPNSNETFLLAHPNFEQKLLKTVRKMDKKACINLVI